MAREEVLGLVSWFDACRCRCHGYTFGYAHVPPAGVGVPAVADEVTRVGVILDRMVVGVGVDIGADRVGPLAGEMAGVVASASGDIVGYVLAVAGRCGTREPPLPSVGMLVHHLRVEVGRGEVLLADAGDLETPRLVVRIPLGAGVAPIS